MTSALEPESPPWKGMSLSNASANGRALTWTPAAASSRAATVQAASNSSLGSAFWAAGSSRTVAFMPATLKPRPRPP